MLSNGAPHARNGSISNGASGELPPFRHMSTGSLNIPNGLGVAGQNGAGQPQSQVMGPGARFEGSRSPPGKQNTSHVPCKFFRQGACQAGKACPFSHDLASTTDNVCKYFAKGNCKFGPKCANIHVLPNGQRVNYHKGTPMGIGGGHLNLGGRVNPDPYHGQSSALTNSLFRANMGPPTPYGPPYSPFQNPEGDFPGMGGQARNLDIGVPTIDTSYVSHPGSAYGSPRDDDLHSRFGLGLSTVPIKGLSVLDAPLPASFDSNGISHIARYGPVAASVPSKFGLESPPPSLGFAKDGRTSEALKNLYNSAFPDDTRDRFQGASSPPAPLADEYFGKRPMHSQRYIRQKIMSASLPKSSMLIDKDWDSEFLFEEDYVPDNLKELLTAEEKARRGSRNAEEEPRPIYSGSGTPIDVNSKFGSPSNASPSRWGPLFQRQQREEEERISRTSAFGHVGSPLRNSSLNPSSTPGLRSATAGSGDSSPFLASPPRQSSMSLISRELQRTKLGRTDSSGSDSSGLFASRVTSNPTPIGSGLGSNLRRESLDRQVSAGSIGAGRFTTPIDEEHVEFVFSMEEEEGDKEVGSGTGSAKRNSGGPWGYGGGRSPAMKPREGNGNVSGGGIEGMFGLNR